MCSSLHGQLVCVRRVIHVVVHNGLTDVGSVLVCSRTHFFVAICYHHLFVNFCIRRYCIYSTDIKILGDLLLQMIDQGNMIDSPQQVIQKWIMTVLGLLKSGKVRLRRTIDRGNLIKLRGMRYNKFVRSMETLFSTEVPIRKVRRDAS